MHCLYDAVSLANQETEDQFPRHNITNAVEFSRQLRTASVYLAMICSRRVDARPNGRVSRHLSAFVQSLYWTHVIFCVGIVKMAKTHKTRYINREVYVPTTWVHLQHKAHDLPGICIAHYTHARTVDHLPTCLTL